MAKKQDTWQHPGGMEADAACATAMAGNAKGRNTTGLGPDGHGARIAATKQRLENTATHGSGGGSPDGGASIAGSVAHGK